MSSKSKKELATNYFLRLIQSKNRDSEKKKIIEEINNLEYPSSNTLFSTDDKLEILKELRLLTSDLMPLDDSWNSWNSWDSCYSAWIGIDSDSVIKARDNSGILDIIDSIEDDIKKR